MILILYYEDGGILLTNSLLEVKNVSKSFGENTVLKDVNFSLNRGEILGLVGENGAGKSTLMNIIFGMEVIRETGGYNGEIYFDGKLIDFKNPIDALNAGIGMVHQEFNPWIYSCRKYYSRYGEDEFLCNI